MDKKLTYEDKLRKRALELYFETHDGLSDIEEEGKSIEWDTLYGRFWKTYDTIEEMNLALEVYRLDMELFVENYVAEKLAEQQKRKELTSNRLGDYISADVLNKLKTLLHD